MFPAVYLFGGLVVIRTILDVVTMRSRPTESIAYLATTSHIAYSVPITG
jgi:hypothetical protein